MQGWIMLYRELLQKSIWLQSTPEQKVILITLLLMANHKENEWEWKGEKFSVKSGQFITSLETISSKCGKGISIQNVRTALKRFEKYGFLTNESTNKNRLITITNWGFFQDLNKQTNKELTNAQQTTNKQLATNNNEKMRECKNLNNKEEILKQAKGNVAYQELVEFLMRKRVPEEDICRILVTCKEENLHIFSMKDVENQYTHMMKQINQEGTHTHYGFSVYFVKGLKTRVHQSRLADQYKKEKMLEKQNFKPIKMYNWFEEKEQTSTK